MTTGVEDFDAFADERATIADLRSAHRRVLRQLDEAKRRQADVVEAVYRASHDAIAGLHIPPVRRPKADPRAAAGETALVFASDWQLGKRTPSYGVEVCEERIERLADKTVELTRIARTDHPVRKVVLALGGDIVEGELIFPGQAHRIDASLFEQTHVHGPRILGNLVRRLEAEFEEVQVETCIGNHGRIGRRGEFRPETNGDAMLYELVKQVLVAGGSGVRWCQNWRQGEAHWYTIFDVGAKRFLMVHGNQMTRGNGGFGGIPFYAFSRKTLGWHAGAVHGAFGERRGFDYMLTAHYHQAISFPVGPLVLYGNGTTESDNTYALEELASMGRPCQWLLFVHPDRGVTSEYRVWLD